jgi:hypothetical protein
MKIPSFTQLQARMEFLLKGLAFHLDVIAHSADVSHEKLAVMPQLGRNVIMLGQFLCGACYSLLAFSLGRIELDPSHMEMVISK